MSQKNDPKRNRANGTATPSDTPEPSPFDQRCLTVKQWMKARPYLTNAFRLAVIAGEVVSFTMGTTKWRYVFERDVNGWILKSRVKGKEHDDAADDAVVGALGAPKGNAPKLDTTTTKNAA